MMTPAVPLLDRDELPLELEVKVKKDAQTLNIGGICSLAVVGSEFYLLRSCVLIRALVDLELKDDDLDVLSDIKESNRGEQHNQLRVDSSSDTS